MILNCDKCTSPIMKEVSLISEGAAVFIAKMRCPHCQAPQIIKIHNQVATIVVVNNSQVKEESSDVRVL